MPSDKKTKMKHKTKRCIEVTVEAMEQNRPPRITSEKNRVWVS